MNGERENFMELKTTEDKFLREKQKAKTLEKVLEDRTRELYLRNEELTSSNEKLRANEQQLRVANEELPLEDIAASFQEAAVDVLVTKTMRAVSEQGATAVSVTGGVSANRRLREVFLSTCKKRGIEVFFPELSLCTDNAAMIAAAGYARIKRGEVDDLNLDVLPNSPLEVRHDS